MGTIEARPWGGPAVLGAAAAVVLSAGCFTPTNPLAPGKALGNYCSAPADCPAPLDCMAVGENPLPSSDGGALHICSVSCFEDSNCDFPEVATNCAHFWNDAGVCLRSEPE